MWSFVRKQLGRIADEISSHLIHWVVAALLAGAGGLAFLLEASRVWLFTNHTIIAPGWLVIVVVPPSLAGIVACAYLGIRGRLGAGWRYEDQADVSILAEDWLRRHQPRVVGGEFTWRYDVIEYHLDIKPGSLRRCFSKVAEETGWWRILSEGPTTVHIRFEPTRPLASQKHPSSREPPLS